MRPNGFNLLRIAAATLVVIGHAWLLTGHNDPNPIRFSDFAFGFGRIGVIVFMLLSGYLVCSSWMLDPHWRRFARKRLLRICPALLIMIVAAVALIGPFNTTLSFGQYVTNPRTWSYVVRNALIVPTQSALPGVFAHNPVPYTNKVLWTLGVEVVAYGAVLVAGARGLLRKELLLAGAVLFTLAGWPWLQSHVDHNQFAYFAPRLQLFGCFWAGAAVRAYDWRPGGACALGAAAILLVTAIAGTPLSLLIVPCGAVMVLYLGSRTLASGSSITRLGDPSYGMYIYGYMIEQLLVAHALRHGSPIEMVAVALPCTLAVGYASWHLIERPALRWKPAPVPRSTIGDKVLTVPVELGTRAPLPAVSSSRSA